MDDPFLVPPVPKPADRSANKPTYLLIVDSLEAKQKFAYFKSTNVVRNAIYVELKGNEITKTQADNLIKNPTAAIENEVDINIEIPWSQVRRIINVTYNKQQQGKQNVK